MPFTPEHLAIAIAGAFVAGAINALAGNGSVITLSILTTIMGLPGVVANGTNRVGVLMNAAGAIAGFANKRKINYRSHLQYILPVIAGAMAGIVVAAQVTSEQFMGVFRFLMIIMLLVILVNPQRWLIAHAGKSAMPKWLEWPAMLVLGFYGGFIQMGMGVFYLAILVLIAKLPIIESNMIKVLAVGAFTLLAVIIFAFSGLIVWPVGLVMGLAQFAGGWCSAHYAAKIPGAAKYAYYVLLLAVLISIFKLFHFF